MCVEPPFSYLFFHPSPNIIPGFVAVGLTIRCSWVCGGPARFSSNGSAGEFSCYGRYDRAGPPAEHRRIANGFLESLRACAIRCPVPQMARQGSGSEQSLQASCVRRSEFRTNRRDSEFSSRLLTSLAC